MRATLVSCLQGTGGVVKVQERILVVDDDPQLLQVTVQYLKSEGFAVLEARDGEQALQLWREHQPDLVVLDWMLPKQSGIQVAKAVRRQGKTPIVMLTARSEETDKLLGLELGADDYLTKPFSFRELVARIRAVLRRTNPESEGAEIIECGELTIDLTAHAVHRGGEEILLTATEFKLLVLLAQHPNRVFSRLQLMESSIGEYYEGYDRAIDTHVSRLRRKLGLESLIQTVHGVGYKLALPRG